MIFFYFSIFYRYYKAIQCLKSEDIKFQILKTAEPILMKLSLLPDVIGT